MNPLPAILEDWRFYSKTCGFVAIANPGLHCLLLYRIGHYLYLSSFRRVNPLWYLYLAMVTFAQIFYKIEIPETAQVGQRLFLPHPYGLVMGPNTTILDDCTIGPWVVIGHNGKIGDDPFIGNHVYIAPHACILGKIMIGHNTFIGANTVVVEDVPDGTAVSSPKNCYSTRHDMASFLRS